MTLSDLNRPISEAPVWFVTGASRGLGAAIVRVALNAGYRVVATSRNAGAIQAAFPNEKAECLLALSLDVTVPGQAQSAVEATVARYGRIDVLINNAGYGQLGQFEEVSEVAIKEQFETNVFGLMHVTRAVLPLMRTQRCGHIFNVSSIGGMAGFAGATVYCSSKFAVAGFSASLADEVAQFGIKVTSVLPGYFRTDFLAANSVRYGDSVLEDYSSTSTTLRSQFDNYNQQQPGDPEKLASALINVAQHPQPPLCFVVGADAVSIASSEMNRVLGEIKDWRALSETTNIS
jgi:NAD(P)-dependent dehydrogenase (short-subunit alcohol dehydrogenase family)